jgi:hypothetical protein
MRVKTTWVVSSGVIKSDEGGINIIPQTGRSTNNQPRTSGVQKGPILKARSGLINPPDGGDNKITGGGEKQSP